jgi:hypothetical protein
MKICDSADGTMQILYNVECDVALDDFDKCDFEHLKLKRKIYTVKKWQQTVPGGVFGGSGRSEASG